MQDNTISLLVVGNKFRNLTRHPNTLTYDQLELALQKMIETNPLDATYMVSLGQGLSDEQSDKLKRLVKSNQVLTKHIRLKENTAIERSSKNFTHKHAEENILISDPFKIEKNEYAAYLMINDECAEMSDHVTGQHLQGMLLVEAARQLTLAVTEKYFIEESQRKNVGFVTDKLEVNFKHYAFPIETFMQYTIDRVRGVNSINRSYQVTIQFIQSHRIVAEVKYGFSTFNKNFLYEKENEAALDVLKTLGSEEGIVYDTAAA